MADTKKERPDAAPNEGDARLQLRDAAVRKIFPINLTAEADYLVPGNPVVTRLEDSVANCFPGLELDVRGLDRRFFPGLVFEFIDNGARLEYLDIDLDPELGPGPDQADASAPARRLFSKLRSERTTLESGHWFLSALKQGDLDEVDVSKLGGTRLWRFVRGLSAVDPPVTITLRQREDRAGATPMPDAQSLSYTGWRRRFTDKDSGVISAAYQPGELTQGLCSPWQHDFRDCACHYWAANHPDVVLPETYPGEQSEEPELPLDWLRVQRERGRQAEARETFALNRPYQLDHFQINRDWQELRVVVEGREIDSLYVPPTADGARPFGSAAELEQWLVYLARLELALSFEYLYARYSMRSEEDRTIKDPNLRDAIALARHRLLLIASSEMQHLRWSNQILWELAHPDRGLLPRYKPVLGRAKLIPAADPVDMPQRDRARRHVRMNERTTRSQLPREPVLPRGRVPTDFRPAKLRPLTLELVDQFTVLEHRSQFIDASYSRVVATLRQAPYPTHAEALALRIVSDGVEHEKHFRQIRQALEPHAGADGTQSPWLREGFNPAKGKKTAGAERALKSIAAGLKAAYIKAAANQFEASAQHVGQARVAMSELSAAAEKLAQSNLGVPFFDIWDSLHAPH